MNINFNIKHYRALSDAFTKDMQYDPPKDKKVQAKNKAMGVVAVCVIMIPVAVGSGLLIYLATKTLARMGETNLAISLMYHLITLFTMWFGINVIFNELYFSSDLERVLPLPLRGWEIATAKFRSVYRMENVMQFLIILSCTIGYGLATGMSPIRWPLSILAGFGMSLVPMLYCAILGMLFMTFTRLIRSKDTVRKLSIGFMLIVFVVLTFLLSSLRDSDIEDIIVNASGGELAFIRVMNCIFPENKYIIEMMSGQGIILPILKFIAFNLVVLAVFLLAADKLYLKSITRMEEGSGRKAATRSAASDSRTTRKHSLFMAYFMKEVRVLVRTTAFMSNCILVTFIWPIFVVAAGIILGVSMDRASLVELYGDGSTTFALAVLVMSYAVPIIITSMNSLGSNAFSREGQDFYMMRYIPVSMKLQWHMKAKTGVVLSALGTTLYQLIFYLYISLPIALTLAYTLISFISVVLIILIGMYIDAQNPKIIWEDALTALRENFNTFFSMGIGLMILAVLAVVTVLLTRLAGLPAILTAAVTLLLLIIAVVPVYRKGVTAGVKYIEDFESI